MSTLKISQGEAATIEPKAEAAPAKGPTKADETEAADAETGGEPEKVVSPAPRSTKRLKEPTQLPGKPGEMRPLAAQPLGWTKETRPGTKRHDLVGMLRTGTTLERIMKKMAWSRNDAREAVRQIHRELGYGIAENGAKLQLVENAPAALPSKGKAKTAGKSASTK